MGKKWTEYELATFDKMAASGKNAIEIANVLGRTRLAVESKARELGRFLAFVERKQVNRRVYTLEMDKIIQTRTAKEASKILGIPHGSIKLRRRQMPYVIPESECDVIVQKWVRASDVPMVMVDAPRSVFDVERLVCVQR